MSNSIFLEKQETRIIKMKDKKQEEILNKIQANKLLIKEEINLFFPEQQKTHFKDFKKLDVSEERKRGLKC